jgi:soluble lytic murein transglycosylase-like protein
MARLLPVLIAVGIGGVALAIARESLATVNWGPPVGSGKKGAAKMARSIKEAAKRLPKDVVASASKWAKARGIALTDVLATIVLESRGNPKAHALTEKEDSRGLMQVNVRAHKAILDKLGYKPEDLWKLDVGVEVGTAIFAAYRQRVLDAIKKNPVAQAHDVGTLTRLRYAGPKYVDSMLAKAKTTADTVHPFKNAEVYVDHWKEAKQGVAEALAAGTYA